MGLTITDYQISGDKTRHTARRVPGHQQAWEVSWLPGLLLDRNTTITAMVLADVVASDTPQAGDQLWPHIQGWAAEIGLTAPEALARVSESLTPDRDGAAPSDPEAAG